MIQVAFGSDFSEMWDDKSLGLKRSKGTGKLTFLIANVFKGLMKKQRSPLFEVQIQKFINATFLGPYNPVRLLFI